MTKEVLSVGLILRDVNSNKMYRIIAIMQSEITLCEMNIKSLSLSLANKKSIMNLIADEELIVESDSPVVFNQDKLPPKTKEKYELKLKIINDVIKAYGPTFKDLDNGKFKPEVESILQKYKCTRNMFWRTCTAYFQSGMRNSSLVDSRYFGTNTGKKYNYESKTGRPSEYVSNTGVVLSPEIQEYFAEALKDYKSGRHKTIKAAYDKMNLLHFTRSEIINGVSTEVLLPASERPTFRQFSYYISKNISNQEKDLIKTSALEQRNNKRLLVSDSLFGVQGPGDMVEIDACEADISLVSMLDPKQTVGRPIVYFMIDVYSRIILAMSVAFDNNSIIGLTNLFLNLADDKQEYCAKYGISYENKNIWPSNIIPNHVRVDRGAEFRGKEFDRICDELGIDRILVTPGSGSLKGVVEQSFHQLHTKQNVHLENHGLIEKRYNSNHHQTAQLNIEEYTRMVINFVLVHNQQCLKTYPLTKNMITQKIKPIPATLWEYGIKNCEAPRPIPAKEQYLFNLMIPIKAKVSRRGISYKDLWYLNTEDRKLAREMFDAGQKKISFEARMDMRDVGAIYYLRDNKLMVARLNPLLNGNADYSGLTMKQYEDYLKSKRQLLAEGKVHNEELSAFNYAMNNAIIEGSTRKELPSAKNMRAAREIEKQAKSKANKISKRLGLPESIETPITEDAVIEAQIAEVIDAPTEKKESGKFVPKYKSWDEALDDFE